MSNWDSSVTELGDLGTGSDLISDEALDIQPPSVVLA